MKKTFLTIFALLLLLNLRSHAQFKLSGRIVNFKGTEKLQINIPVVFGFHQENSAEIPVSKNGSFAITLPITEPKFASLLFERKMTSLLLHPGKDLNVLLNEKDGSVTFATGSGKKENQVLQAVDLTAYPFFFADSTADKFKKQSLSQLKNTVIDPYIRLRDAKIAKVVQSNIAIKDKIAIQSEIIAISYNYLNDFARTALNDRNVIDSLILAIFDGSEKTTKASPAGPQYYAFIRNYLGYLETKAFIKVKPDQFAANEKIPNFGLTIDSATKLIKSFGKPYWRWIGAINNLPLDVVERFAYQEILNLYNTKDLTPLKGLSSAFLKQFPNSRYKSDILKKIDATRKILAENETNAKIKVFPNYEKVKSIYEVVQTLKGKVIYVDVWGTWCGPCKEELRYNPALRAYYAKKDVEFIYLDMDEDEKDTAWKEFIKVNGLEGIHLRKNRAAIQTFWPELLAKTADKEQYYPQYFIFDKNGKLVVSKAERPSTREVLYAQIDQFLK